MLMIYLFTSIVPVVVNYVTQHILHESDPVIKFWTKLLHAQYDQTTRKLDLADNTVWLGGTDIPTHSIYVREHYQRLWLKMCCGMTFTDNGVRDHYDPDDADQRDRDLSGVRARYGEGLKGHVVNGTPGGFLLPNHSTHVDPFRDWEITFWLLHTVATTLPK